MSSEGGGGNIASSSSGGKSTTGGPSEGSAQQKHPSTATDQTQSTISTGEHAVEDNVDTLERKPAARPSPQQEGTGSSAPQEVSPDSAERPRQVIAVSANRGPTAFFNLAKRFLITDEYCDLSALEGAIVSAVDAAHLLERSKLATIVRVHTSYVTVEPKRKKRVTPPVEGGSGIDQPQPSESAVAHGPSSAVAYPQSHHQQYTQEGRPPSRRREGKRGDRELRRARIVITVRRTAAYKQWLDDNPLQAVIAGDGDDENRPTDTQAEPSDSSKPS